MAKTSREEAIHRVIGNDPAYDPFEQLEVLAELSQAFAQSLDIQVTLDNVVNRIVDYMGAEAASIFLIDDDSGRLVCRASAGPVDVTGFQLPVGEGIVGRAVSENRAQLVSDVGADTDFLDEIDCSTGFLTRSVVCSPLQTSDGVIGVLQVLNKRGGELFDERDRDVLRVLASPTALAINNARMALDLVEQRRIKKELKLARSIQRSLLPRRRRPPFPILGINIPAREVSGDFFDYFELTDGRIGFTIGDVSGKGVDASLLMVKTTSLLRWSGKQGDDPAQWLAGVNDELCETVSRGMFVCGLAGYYDPSSGDLCWANAGFPPVLRHDSAGEFREFPAAAPPLGIVPGQRYPQHETNLDNASLYLYSDGVTESRTAGGKQLGSAGFLQIIREGASSSPERRLGALVSDLRRREISDDTTLLLIEDRQRWQMPLVEFGFTSEAENLRMLRTALADAMESLGCGRTLIGQVQLVVNEACANIIQHAYAGDEKGKIICALRLQRQFLVIELRDFAPPVDCCNIRPRDLSECRPGGLGVNLIDSIVDEWTLENLPQGEGNLMVMKKRIRGEI